MAFDLTHILRPLDPDAFIARHWARRPLHVRGTPAKFRPLGFGAPSLRAHCAGPTPPEVVAQHHDIDGVPRGVVVEARLAEPLFRAGMTLCFERLEQFHPGLARCAAAFKLGLHYPDTIAVNAYWSPDGAGFGLHFDCHQTFILQLEGEKRWRHSAAPLVPFPPGNLPFGDPDAVAAFRRDYPWAEVEPPLERNLVEQVLRPGDVLYMPAGPRTAPTRADARSASPPPAGAPLSRAALARAVVDAARGRCLATAATVFRRRPVGAAPFPRATEDFIAARISERDMVTHWTPADCARTFFSSVGELPFRNHPQGDRRRSAVPIGSRFPCRSPAWRPATAPSPCLRATRGWRSPPLRASSWNAWRTAGSSAPMTPSPGPKARAGCHGRRCAKPFTHVLGRGVDSQAPAEDSGRHDD